MDRVSRPASNAGMGGRQSGGAAREAANLVRPGEEAGLEAVAAKGRYGGGAEGADRRMAEG